jgi:hypothetical protein
MTIEGKSKILKQLEGLDDHWLFDKIDRRSIQILVERINDAKDFEQMAKQLKGLKRDPSVNTHSSMMQGTYNSNDHFEIREILGI